MAVGILRAARPEDTHHKGELMIAGIGVDVVSIAAFAEQLREPGSRFPTVFTARERRMAELRACSHASPGEDASAPHLAARWAAKEAFIKAWSSSLGGEAVVETSWDEIEVISGVNGVPSLTVRGEMARAFHESCGHCVLHVSLSHDGDTATAFVVVEKPDGSAGGPGSPVR